MDSQLQEKIGQIQLIQQNIENFSMQKQQFQLQQSEIEAALKEMENSEDTYKIIGNIMVSISKDKLSAELNEKLEMLNIRITTIERQEDKLRIKFEELQQDVMSGLETNDSKNKKAKQKEQND